MSARFAPTSPVRGEKEEVFMVRVSNSTEELRGQELLDYQA